MMYKNIILILFLALIFSCKKQKQENHVVKSTVKLTQSQAERLIQLPLKCIHTEYPNKLSNVLASEEDLGNPKLLHPAFYGCFDWHSSVHGHWVLVKLLKEFPSIENKEEAIGKLRESITPKNIAQEIAYFSKKHEYSYERTYGWAWLLQLQLELDTWNTEEGKQLANTLQPLTNILSERYIEFLPKLNYPLRVGTHSNTGFGLTFAYDYAKNSNNTQLQEVIETTAKRLFLKDEFCPLAWEPSGSDFLSPCLEEVDIMRRVLPEHEFLPWMKNFLPQLFQDNFSWEVAKVSDRTDGHLVHLDGLNFSRAWIMYGLAKQYPNEFLHLLPIADVHMQHSLSGITDGNYEGEHWLASFALYALSENR